LKNLFTRAGLALGLSVYAWAMLGVDAFLRLRQLPPEGPDRGLAVFRRLVMGNAVLALGAMVLIAAIVLAIQSLRRGDKRGGGVALLSSLAWIPALVGVLLI
jgi:hypothetical protein